MKLISEFWKEEDAVGVVEVNSRNSSTNENFKEMLKTLYFQCFLGFC